MMTRHVPAAVVTALMILAASWACAQAPLAEWSFDDDVGQWQVADPASQLAVTADANAVREDDNAVAECSYSAGIGTMSGISIFYVFY